MEKVEVALGKVITYWKHGLEVTLMKQYLSKKVLLEPDNIKSLLDYVWMIFGWFYDWTSYLCSNVFCKFSLDVAYQQIWRLAIAGGCYLIRQTKSVLN